jgi:hypothetical protein
MQRMSGTSPIIGVRGCGRSTTRCIGSRCLTLKLTGVQKASILEAMPSVPVFNSLEASRAYDRTGEAARQRWLEIRAKQVRCVKVLPSGAKCDGIAVKGADGAKVWCFNHDPSPEGKAKRARRNAHFSQSLKLRLWEMRQVRVREVNPAAAYSLGYAPMQAGTRPWINRKKPVEL